MRSKLTHIFAGIFILLAFVQCEDSITPIMEPEPGQGQEQQLSQTQLLSPENGSLNSTTLSFEWSKVDGAKSYQIQLSTSEDFSSPLVDGTNDSTNFKVTELPGDATISWKVRPVLQGQKGPWSEINTFSTTAKTENSEPITASPQSPKDGSTQVPADVRLQWTTVASASAYDLQIATDESFTNIVDEQEVQETSYQTSGISIETTYYWRVRPTVESEKTKWSNAYSFTTKESGASTTPPATDLDGIVTVSNGDFMLNGEVFRFAGTNAYYLPNYQKIDPSMVENTLDTFEEAGVTVVRVWGFYDGQPQYNNDITFQPEPGVYNEEALRYLDQLIAKGKERGIRFVVALINYWDELGGVPKYNEWDGNPGGGMMHFVNDPDTQRWYKNYVKMLLNRTNTVTGVKYKNSSAIFSWEIMNEGRMPNGTPEQLADWYQEMAQYIKSIDPNHMVSTGEEGFGSEVTADYSVDQYANTYPIRANLGTSYTINTSIPEIDYGTAHWYPSNWGYAARTMQEVISAQRAWITDLSNIAEKEGKPFVLGEYGYVGWGNSTQLEIYEDMWSTAEKIELDGSLIWELTSGHVKCYEYGGNICADGGRQDTELYNAFKTHIEAMSNSK